MYYVNIPKLIGRIAEEGYNQASFAEAIGVNRNTLRAYLKDYSKIPYDVLSKMASVLHCGLNDATDIFFAR